MALRIEDYALLGNLSSSALVGTDGSIDWLCLPRFDSPASFAALLGDERHGRWQIRPSDEVQAVRRRYRPGTMVLETEFDTADGTVRLIDFMPLNGVGADIVRIVEGVRGQVTLESQLIVRFHYGRYEPMLQPADSGYLAIAGPDAVCVRTPVGLSRSRLGLETELTVSEGQRVPFLLSQFPSHEAPPAPGDAFAALDLTEKSWQEWTSRSTYAGDYAEPVQRSLLTLRALTYGPTGGVVAAPTTSLPEQLGGSRNWDYRFCWLRDSVFTVSALVAAGYRDEAIAWRDWMLRAVAGHPEDVQIMYGIAGERQLPEEELAWLPGYEDSRPVRVGNAAAEQFQLDVYGEVLNSAYLGMEAGLGRADGPLQPIMASLLGFVVDHWRDPDEGIWEIRGPRRQFTHSKLMAWVAVDRAVKAAEAGYLRGGDVKEWRRTRAAIHDDICRRGYDAQLGSFTQYYGSGTVDASLLLMPVFGFLPPDDPRLIGTVEAIQRQLGPDGFVLRYTTTESVDGLPPGENPFIFCSFWLVRALVAIGRVDEARELFDRLLDIRNDVGLLAEEYDPVLRRQIGNFPQAFSHLGLIVAALSLDRASGQVGA